MIARQYEQRARVYHVLSALILLGGVVIICTVCKQTGYSIESLVIGAMLGIYIWVGLCLCVQKEDWYRARHREALSAQ